MIGAVMCPICGGRCIETMELHYVVESRCAECKNWKYEYDHITGKHISTIGNVAYMVSESLEDEQYDQMEMAISHAVLYAQELHYGKVTKEV